MSKLEKLDLMGVASLAVVTVALLVAWMVTSQEAFERHTRQDAPAHAMTLTRDGSMKLTVTAEPDSPVDTTARTTRTASARSFTGPTQEVALPLAFRP